MSDVFISYSRKDIAFARLIREALQQSQIDTWIDWDRIPIGERWWQEICEAIQNANVFMFIISQNSIGSKVCKEEIELALKSHKRIIPVVVDDLKPEAIQEFVPDLPQYNWIIFERDHIFRLEVNPHAVGEKPEDRMRALPQRPQFEQALEKLNKAIHTDWEWVKNHTRLQVDALRWENNEKNSSYLIRGAALEEAEQRLFRAAGKEPQPSELQVEYVTASRQEETQRQSEQLQFEQKSRRRQQMVLWAVGIGLLVAVVLGVVAWGQRNQYLSETQVRATAEANAIGEANSRATAEANAIGEAQARATAQMRAEVASTQAVQQRDEAVRQAALAISGKLMTDSSSLMKTQIDLALLLSVQSYRTAQTSQSIGNLLNSMMAQPRLLRVLPQAENTIYSVALSPDGRLLAAGSCGKWKDSITCQQSLIQLWDPASGQMIGSLRGEENTSAVHGLAFRPDGKTLLATSQKGNLVEWDIASQKSLGSYRWRDIRAPAVAFSPDRTWMAVGSCAIPGGEEVGLCSQGGVFLYDTLTHQQIGEPLIDHERYVYSVAISPDGTLLASGGGDSRVFLYNRVDGMHRLILEGAKYDAFFSLAFSPDGKTLAAGNTNGEIYLIDVASGNTIGSPLIGHDIIFGLAFRPDGKMLASSGCALRLTDCSEGEVILWDPDQRTMIGDSLHGFQGEIRAIEFSTDGSVLVGGYQQNLALWSANTTQALAQNIYWEDTKASGFVNSSAFSPDGRLLAASISNFIGIWNAADGSPVNANMIGHTQEVRAISFSPDGRTLYTAGKDKTVIQWDAATGLEITRPINGEMGYFSNSTLSPDGSRMASIVNGKLTIYSVLDGVVITQIPVEKMPGITFNPDGTQVAVYGCVEQAEQANSNGVKECLVGGVLIYEVSTGKLIDLGFPQRQGSITGFAFSQDGKLLAIGGEDRQIILWDLDTQAASGAAVNLSEIWTGKYGYPKVITLSPGGEYLAVGSGIESKVLVIDLATREPVGLPIDECINFSKFAFSPNGQILAVGCTGIELYDMVSLELVEKIDRGGTNTVTSLVFSPNGQYLINGDTYEGVDIWDISVQPAISIATLRGHASDLNDLVVAEDGKVLLSLSNDLTINRWEVSALGSDPGPQAEFPLIDQPVQGYPNQNANVAFSLDASRFISASCRISLASYCLQTEVQVYELPSGRKLSSFQIEGKRGKLAISPDGEMIAIYVEESATGVALDPPGKVFFWDLKKQAFVGNPIEGLLGTNYALQYSPDGQTVAVSTSRSGALYRADGNRELLFQLSSGAYSLAFSSDGSYLAEGLSRLIVIREMQQGNVVGAPLTGGFVLTYGLSFRPDGTQLASGDNGGHLLLWNLDEEAWISSLCQKANRNLSIEEWKTYLGDLPYQETCPK